MSDTTKMPDKTENYSSGPRCLCVRCTCTGCHVDCYGHCKGCGKIITDCNGYQTEGKNEKHT